MEWQFKLNWAAIVEEAKRRRKAQKLTQKRLALIAKVSTPTISRFESGEQDIQLSSIITILSVLGLIDKRTLTFPTPKQKYNFERAVVVFWGYTDGHQEIRCAISLEALQDHFDNNSHDDNALHIFNKHQKAIEHEARRKYLANQFEPDGSILIKSNDLL
jgi:transcriptional regulator with XRE-family HTH domain